MNADCPFKDQASAAGDANKTAGNFRFRHNGNQYCNVLFVDGHGAGFRYGTRTTSEIKRSNIHVDSQP